jgi:hypothetical protein
VCAELRKSSRELKDQLKLNNERKARLETVVEKQLQFEQYQQVLDMLDSQVDQIYVKHHVRVAFFYNHDVTVLMTLLFSKPQRAQKSKSKRKPIVPIKTMPDDSAWPIQRRKLWVDSIGAIFRDRSVIMPKDSIYTGLPTSITDEKTNRNIDSNNNSKSSSQIPKPMK